jgi:hypothetical protein
MVWTPNDIATVASASGKPLEVSAAQAFLAVRGWSAHLGTYFDEHNTLKPPRELDVLAVKESLFDGQRGVQVTCRLQGLISCKGCTPTQEVVGYSLGAAAVPAFAARVLSQHRAPRNEYPTETYGRLEDLEKAAAARILANLALATAPRVVALDIVDDKAGTKRLVGDKDLFEGIDSALKAAFYWQQVHLSGEQCITLHVPVLVVLRPWWQVPIDGGTIGTPTQCKRGYLTCRYPNPDHGPPRARTVEVTVIIVSRDDVDNLVSAFEDLHIWLSREAIELLGRDAPLRTWP